MNDLRTRSEPTTAAGRDLSAYDARTSAHSESDLMVGYRAMPPERTLPCDCGLPVTADVECPAGDLRRHQTTGQHRAWRQRLGL